MSLLTISLVLFLIMDPIGNVAPYLTMMRKIEPRRQLWVTLREMGFALLAMVIFNFFGEALFTLLEMSETTVKLASGVILFLIAVQILFPHFNGIRNNIPEEEPFIVPLAVPLIAGPSLLATIMLFAHIVPDQWMTLAAILIAWLGALAVLLSSKLLLRLLGINGLMACEKLMGMVLVLLAVQRFMDGIAQFIKSF